MPAQADAPFPASPNASLDYGQAKSFLPIEQAYPLELDMTENGGLLLYWPIHTGYYLYRERFSFIAHKDNMTTQLPAKFPSGITREDEYFGRSEVFYGNLLVEIADAEAKTPFILEVHSQGCADAGLCYPPRKQFFNVSPQGISEIAESEWRPSKDKGTPMQTPVAEASLSYTLLMAVFAILGGLILNLMPCVFPVLSLKVLSVSQSHDHSASRKLRHGLVYTAGVILSFLVVAATLIALRRTGAAIGWGFHLQTPWFVALLVYLLFAMALSLSGVVELGAGLMGVGNALTMGGGLSASFFTGVLAAVVASPCTAPFMGTALGFAMTQPAGIAMTVFGALGFGMALPFLLLMSFPRLYSRLPKPGPWMERFRQFMAFPLYAAALWLLWVLGKQTSVSGMAAVAAGALLIAVSMWFWRAGSHHWRSRSGLVAALLLICAIGILRSPVLGQVGQRGEDAPRWESYSRDRAEGLRRAGKAYFVNVTADWCITCLANERFALSDAAVLEAFDKFDISMLKGDWTNNDPELTALLRRHGRSGVPLYLLVSTHGASTVLPQLLTPGVVIEAIQTSQSPEMPKKLEISSNYR